MNGYSIAGQYMYQLWKEYMTLMPPNPPYNIDVYPDGYPEDLRKAMEKDIEELYKELDNVNP